MEDLYKCPCCGHKTLTEIYNLDEGTGYDICPLCGWEDDGTTDIYQYRSINRGSIADYRKRLVKMSDIVEKKYDEWKETLDHCGLFLLTGSDDEIEYHIFEEFDICVRVYCNDDMLELFLDNGFIDEKMKKDSSELFKLFCEIQTQYSQLWNIEAVRTHPRWKRIMELADFIKTQIYV